MDLLELDQGIDPATHWYYHAKASALVGALRRSSHHPRLVKDVGAGSGYFSMALINEYPGCRAICIDPNYSDEQLAESNERVTFSREDSDEPADLYLFMDVIEHVADDIGLILRYSDGASPGSLFFFSVPAFEFLWSGHDVYLGHYRRYTLAQLECVVRQAGLAVVKGRYLYAMTLPAVIAVRFVRRHRRGVAAASDLRTLPPSVDRVLRKVLEWETRIGANRVAGSTAVVVARK